jgi:hypothetical protein
VLDRFLGQEPWKIVLVALPVAMILRWVMRHARR